MKGGDPIISRPQGYAAAMANRKLIRNEGDMKEREFIETIGAWAKMDMEVSGVLASITIAQAILESGWGKSELAVQANNFFGMKICLSGNTWKSVWDGKSKYTKLSPEHDTYGKQYMKESDFRSYESVSDSIRDHSLYLTGAMKGRSLRYSGLAGEKDYRKGIQIIKNGGYATDVNYVSKVCKIIEQYGLAEFDVEGNKLKIIDKIATKNPCYKSGNTITPKGGMLHSVGCPQPDPAVFASIWDNANAKVCVHAVVGKDGTVYQLLPFNRRAWHCGSGSKGSGNNMLISLEMTEPATIKYTAGSNWIELADGSGTKAHVLSAYKYAVEFFAQMAKTYGFDPLNSNCLMSHHEGNRKGIASNHGDVEHIWNKYGLSMEQFRKDVKEAMSGAPVDFGEVTENSTATQKVNPLAGTVVVTYTGDDGVNVRTEPSFGDNVERVVQKGECFTVTGISADEKWYKMSSGLFITAIPDYVQFKATEAQKESTSGTGYFRVRSSWGDPGSQIGAFKSQENAVELCRQNCGYKVYDDSGNEVYPCVKNDKKEIQVRITTTDLRIRKGPGISFDYQKIGGKAVYTGKGVFTVTETQDGPGASRWGLLQSYAREKNGWISMDYAESL